MAWLEAHQELPRHPKTKRFARMLKISIPQAVGHLFLLWWWAVDYAENGDLSKYDADDIADAVQWDGDPEEFLNAMIECGPGDSSGFIEKDDAGNMFVHDWDKYSGRLVEKREKNRQRQARVRKNNSLKKILEEKEEKEKINEKTIEISAKKQKSNSSSSIEKTEEIQYEKNVTRDSAVTSALRASESQGYITEHNRTQQNKTKQNTTAEKKATRPPSKKSAAAVGQEKINLGEIISLWNTKLAPLGFSRVLKQTLPREKALEVLLNSSPDRNKFRWWQEVFDRISSSEFLRKSIQERNWFTLDWLLNEHNLVKVLEGRYDNRAKPAQKNSGNSNAQNEPRANSIDEILAKHRAKNSNAIDAEFRVVEEGEDGDRERSPGVR